MSTRLTRRDFVRVSGVGFGSALLAACGVPPTAVQPQELETSATAAATGTAAGPLISTPGPASGLQVSSILGCPTDRSITVNVLATADRAVTCEYGTASGQYGLSKSGQGGPAGGPLNLLLDGLQPDTRYYYRLLLDNQPGPEASFVTQRAPGSPFTFAIQGDSHPERVGKEFDADLYALTLRNAAAEQPDFYLTAGDDFSVDQLKRVEAAAVDGIYSRQRAWLRELGAPVFLVNGNHEQAAMANLDGTPDNVAVWAQTARNSLFAQPAPDAFYSGDEEPVPFIGPLRDYYAFNWGDALFVILDQYWHSPTPVDNAFGADRSEKGKRDLWQVTIGDAQYQWLRRTLESSPARYKFVFSHHVLGTQRGGIELASKYEWGDSKNLAMHRPGWTKTIHQVMADSGVTIYFQGHDHIFVRQELDGVIYQTLPEPGDPNYAWHNAEAYKSGDKLPNTGHLRVRVSPEEVGVDYIRSYLPQDEKDGHTNGEVAFTYTVRG